MSEPERLAQGIANSTPCGNARDYRVTGGNMTHRDVLRDMLRSELQGHSTAMGRDVAALRYALRVIEDRDVHFDTLKEMRAQVLALPTRGVWLKLVSRAAVLAILDRALKGEA